MFKFLRKLMTLPFLRLEHIKETFQPVDEGAPKALLPMMDCVYWTWIDSSAFKNYHLSDFMTAIGTKMICRHTFSTTYDTTVVATRGLVS